MGADQHAFEEAVGIGVEVVAVLEGAGLALVAIDGHEAGAGLAADGAPFAAGRGSLRRRGRAGRLASRPASTSSTDISPRAQRGQQGVAAGGHVGFVVDVVVGDVRVGVAAGQGVLDGGDVGLVQEVVADLGDGGLVAQADAGGADDAGAGEVAGASGP